MIKSIRRGTKIVVVEVADEKFEMLNSFLYIMDAEINRGAWANVWTPELKAFKGVMGYVRSLGQAHIECYNQPAYVLKQYCLKSNPLFEKTHEEIYKFYIDVIEKCYREKPEYILNKLSYDNMTAEDVEEVLDILKANM